MSWTEDNVVFGEGSDGIFAVPESGGTPEVLISPDSLDGNIAHGPQLLQEGKAILFTLLPDQNKKDEAQIVAQSLETGEGRILLRGYDGRYLPSGHLLYTVNGNLLAVSFDEQQLEVKGESVPVVEGVLSAPFTGVSQSAVSSTGSLAYIPSLGANAAVPEGRLMWVERNGVSEAISDLRDRFEDPRLSPDGTRVAVSVNTHGTLSYDIWIFDVERGSRTRLVHEGSNYWPVWSPDGSKIAFTSDQSGSVGLYLKSASGVGPAESLLSEREIELGAFSWSPDGRELAFHKQYREAGGRPNEDLWILSQSEGKWVASPFLETSFREHSPTFSPDGRFIAYTSDESGQREVYVENYPERSNKWTISTDGGAEPVWSRDQNELFYRNDNRMMAVGVSAEGKFARPRVLFDQRYATEVNRNPNYDVSPDGTRFLMIEATHRAKEIRVVLNWFEELEKLVPTNN